MAGNGYLNGSLPRVPIGVLSSARGKEYSPVTWQPQGSLRFASVSVSEGDYYVLSAQSLRIVEHDENLTYEITALGCIASLAILGLLYLCRRTS